MRPAQGTGGIPMIKTMLVYVLAGGAEIGGCFGIWHWLRNGKSAWWAVPSVLSLLLFAWLLTRVEANAAGRAYAAYGGVYIVSSIAWLWFVEGIRPDRWDILGAAICLAGALIILVTHIPSSPKL